MKSLLYTFVLSSASILLSGCGVIYSQQHYGTPIHHQAVVQGASKTEVIANLGIPNAVYESPNANREAFVYTAAKGKNILGVYSKIERKDSVVVFNENDEVVYAGEVIVGKGSTILSGPFTNATHPISTETLLFEPSNYGYEFEQAE